MELQLGKILSRLLKEKRISLKELSAATGVPSSTLSQWTANREPKKPTQIASVAKYLGVSLHYLLFGTSDENEADLASTIRTQDFFSGIFEISVRRVDFGKAQSIKREDKK